MKTIIFFLIGLLTFSHGRVIDPDELGSRIVNGENATRGERPYQVSLQSHGSHFCGGSIINKYWIVSAAHCLTGTRPSDVKVVVGTLNLRKPYKYHQAVNITIHSLYNPSNSYINDVSLIKVKEPFVYNDVVKPVPLPKSHVNVKTNSTVIISGWGYTANGSLPDILQKVTVYVADPDYCRRVLSKYGMNVHHTQLCANDRRETKGECNGDSGGPVTVNGVLEGIVSWSIKDPGCGSPILPGVHTRVSEYVDWILARVKEN